MTRKQKFIAHYPTVMVAIIGLVLSGCVISENAEWRKTAEEFGGTTNVSGTYLNEGTIRSSDDSTGHTFLHSKFGRLPKGVYYDPEDTVHIDFDGDLFVLTWFKKDVVLDTLRYEQGKDFDVGVRKIVFKPFRKTGGGLAGSDQLEIAKDLHGRLIVLRRDSAGGSLGPDGLGVAPLQRRFIDVMTFEPR